MKQVRSHEYKQFKIDLQPQAHSWYENAAAWSGKVFALSPGKQGEKIAAALEDAHLDVRVEDVTSLSILLPLFTFLSLIILTVFVPFAFTTSLSITSLWFVAFSVIVSLLVWMVLNNMPFYLATRWKQQASNQMVLCIFYMVTFMRHTPNLELAIQFASEHIGPPLALDLKKVLWDVETQRFSNVNESLEYYLTRWRDDAREFIEAVHLVQSSLYENSNDRRITSLEKALEVMLEETYEKMLHYAQNLKSPITMLHMLGIILPVLGLVILPLAVSFFDTHWTMIASGYNVILPVAVYIFGKRILITRPTGYGSSDLSRYPREEHKISPAVEAGLVAGVLFLIGLSPLLIHWFAPGWDLNFGQFDFLDYKADPNGGDIVGPYGLGAGLVSMFLTLASGIGAGLYYRRRSKNLIHVRERARQLENEFGSALFQLGNRIGDGIPVEIAFSKVAATMEGTLAGNFFALVSNNISRLGMSVEEAIFDPQHGALLMYPSNLIESSMKVLLESSRKGPTEASKALMSMSNYIREMHRVDERLKDLLSDVLSSMKSQVNFLLPTIAGIVIGITSMITTVLGAIMEQAGSFEGDLGGGGLPVDLFGLGVPSYFFQFIVGLYVVQVTWILAYLINGVENGIDPLSEMHIKAKSLLLATVLYVAIGFIVMLVFNLIAGQILSSIGSVG